LRPSAHRTLAGSFSGVHQPGVVLETH
jgi:hypothetical protein